MLSLFINFYKHLDEYLLIFELLLICLWFEKQIGLAVLDIEGVWLVFFVGSFLEELGLLFLQNHGIFFRKVDLIQSFDAYNQLVSRSRSLLYQK